MWNVNYVFELKKIDRNDRYLEVSRIYGSVYRMVIQLYVLSLQNS